MAPLIRIPNPWEIPGLEPTPEAAFLDRRSFLRRIGRTGASLAALAVLPGAAGGLLEGCAPGGVSGDADPASAGAALQPIAAPRNPAFTLDRPLSDEKVAAHYNNFYEFTENKEGVAGLARRLQTRPWSVDVRGLVHKPASFDPDDLRRTMPVEERLYRHRCVEAWAMAVPWIGFPLKALLDRVEPMGSARYVRMITFLKPEEAPNQRTAVWYPWPYFEGLTMEEAVNPLTLMGIGIYGHELPPQHGAPLRLVVPWKYGFKSIKSIVRIELTEEQPPTFWNTLSPQEYDFRANVNPAVPHPRWSQASERMIGTGEVRPTLKYNGYGELVAHLYPA